MSKKNIIAKIQFGIEHLDKKTGLLELKNGIDLVLKTDQSKT